MSGPSGVSKSWTGHGASNNTISQPTIATAVVSKASANTQLPGGGREIQYSSAVSNSKPGRKIAANLGLGHDDSANFGMRALDASAAVNNECGGDTDVITTQPASLSSKGNDSHGKGKISHPNKMSNNRILTSMIGHSHHNRGSNKSKGATATSEGKTQSDNKHENLLHDTITTCNCRVFYLSGSFQKSNCDQMWS